MQLLKSLTLLLGLTWLSACNHSLPVEKTDTHIIQLGEVNIADGNARDTSIDGYNETDMALDDSDSILSINGDSLQNCTVYFQYDSSSVSQKEQAILSAHAIYLGEHPNVTVRLEGHTDERGSREYNLALGERRAFSIRHILMLQGGKIDQFEVISFGEERLAMKGSNESVWRRNRRVEIKHLGH